VQRSDHGLQYRTLLIVCLAAAGLGPAGAALASPSCTETAGPQTARRLVEQCLQVSPATHPPCNAANACALIKDEIRRGCALLSKDAPTFCAADRPPR